MSLLLTDHIPAEFESNFVNILTLGGNRAGHETGALDLHQEEELGLMEQSPVLHLDEWEIPRENIVLNRKLGEGAFGAVCGGEVIGLRGEGEWVPVAVKSLKIASLPEDKV